MIATRLRRSRSLLKRHNLEMQTVWQNWVLITTSVTSSGFPNRGQDRNTAQRFLCRMDRQRGLLLLCVVLVCAKRDERQFVGEKKPFLSLALARTNLSNG